MSRYQRYGYGQRASNANNYTTVADAQNYQQEDDNGVNGFQQTDRFARVDGPVSNAELSASIQDSLAAPFFWVPIIDSLFYLSAAIAVFVITGLDTIGDSAVIEDRIGQQWWWANSFRVTYWLPCALVSLAFIQFYHWWNRGSILAAAGERLRISTLPLEFGILSAVSLFLTLAASGKTEFGTLLFGPCLNLTGAVLTGLVEYNKTLWTRDATRKLGNDKRMYQRRTQALMALFGGLLQVTPYVFALIWFSIGCKRDSINCVSGLYVFVIGISVCVLLRVFLQVWSCFTANNIGNPVFVYWAHNFFQIAIVCFAVPTLRNAFDIKDHLSVPNT
jgi:hypothetical protein